MMAFLIDGIIEKIDARLDAPSISGDSSMPARRLSKTQLWLPFSTKFFDCTNEKFGEIVESIELGNSRIESYLIAYENSIYFCEWYEKEQVHQIIQSIKVKGQKVKEVLWYIGNIDEMRQALLNRGIITIPRNELSLVCVLETWESYATDVSSIKFTEYQIKKVGLSLYYKDFYDYWKTHKTNIENYIRRVRSIRLFLLWEEFKYSIYKQVENLLTDD